MISIMKNIYFIQACDVHGAGGNESAYLPYATGLLAAYAFQNEIIKENYCVKRFLYRKEDIADAIASMEQPAVVGFSTYIWNDAYNKKFAHELKKAYPDCVIVFGGHNILNDSPRQLDENPFIDFLIHGEGEITFCELLVELCTTQNFSNIQGLSFRGKDRRGIQNEARAVGELDYPSPYLEGWFDEILEKDDISFSALLETNRGCPFHCAYCDWGSIDLKMRTFPTERVIAELEYFSAHKIQFCFCIDSNFGLFKRDYEIVDAFLEIKEKTGYPEVFKCCTTEGSGLSEFNINKKLNDSGVLKGASLALQTLCNEALVNIGRHNMSIDRYRELTALYNEAGIPTYSEMIYGLPGETYESFTENLSFMLQSGTTRGLFIHYCELLPNSRFAKRKNLEAFGIQTARIPYTQFHTVPNQTVQEMSTIIISTYSMPYPMWVKACIFGLFVQCFHYMGILQCFAKYVFYESSISYKSFYEQLIEWAKHNPTTIIGQYYAEVVRKLGALETGGMISRVHINPVFGDIDWPLEEGMCLEIVSQADTFFREILPFLQSFQLQEAVLHDLTAYQRNILRTFGDTEKTLTLTYDFFNYFRQINIDAYQPLDKLKNILRFSNTVFTDSLEDFATKIVWYGRKSARIMYDEQEIRQVFVNEEISETPYKQTDHNR